MPYTKYLKQDEADVVFVRELLETYERSKAKYIGEESAALLSASPESGAQVMDTLACYDALC